MLNCISNVFFALEVSEHEENTSNTSTGKSEKRLVP